MSKDDRDIQVTGYIPGDPTVVTVVVQGKTFTVTLADDLDEAVVHTAVGNTLHGDRRVRLATYCVGLRRHYEKRVAESLSDTVSRAAIDLAQERQETRLREQDPDALAQRIRDAIMKWNDSDLDVEDAMEIVEEAFTDLDDRLMAGGSLPTFWERLGGAPAETEPVAEYVMEERIYLGTAVEVTLAPDVTVRGIVTGYPGTGMYTVTHWSNALASLVSETVVQANMRILP